MDRKVLSFAATAIQTMFPIVTFKQPTNLVNPHTGKPIEKMFRIPITLTPEFIGPTITNALVKGGFYGKDKTTLELV